MPDLTVQCEHGHHTVRSVRVDGRVDVVFTVKPGEIAGFALVSAGLLCAGLAVLRPTTDRAGARVGRAPLIGERVEG